MRRIVNLLAVLAAAPAAVADSPLPWIAYDWSQRACTAANFTPNEMIAFLRGEYRVNPSVKNQLDDAGDALTVVHLNSHCRHWPIQDHFSVSRDEALRNLC